MPPPRCWRKSPRPAASASVAAVAVLAAGLAAVPDALRADVRRWIDRKDRHNLARVLGSVGHVAGLRRLAVGPFTEAAAISLDSLKALGHSPAAFTHVLPIETALDDIPALALTATEAIRLRSGQPVGLLHRLDRDRIRGFAPGDMVCAMSEGRLVALTRFEAGELVPVRVMNL